MINIEGIPDELKQLNRWVLTEKNTKYPFPATGSIKRASYHKPADLSSFENAVKVLGKNDRFCGIAFAIIEPFAIIDLDKQCIDGNLSDTARDIINRLDSYTEKSLSGNGIHIIVKTSDNNIYLDDPPIEIYSRTHFMTLTGDIFEDRDTIQERQSELLSIIQDYNLIRETEPIQTFQPIKEHLNEDIDFICNRELQKAFSKVFVGNRHNTGMDLACQLRDNRIPLDMAEDTIMQYQAGVPQDGHNYSLVEARDTLESVYKTPARQPSYQSRSNSGGNYFNIGNAATAPKIQVMQNEPDYIPERHLSEMGNAERLVDNFGDDIKYCRPQNKWYIWTGQRWAQDVNGTIETFAKETVRLIYKEASQCADEAGRKAIANHAKQSEAAYKISAMIKLAQSEDGIPITLNQLDADPWLLNCINCVVDLRTGDLLKHSFAKDNLLTKIIPVQYDSNAKLDLWDRFLREATNNDENLITFLQYAAGYSLTGDTSEEKLFFIHGPAASGKSTFIEAMKCVLGDYAKTADFETFLARNFVGGIRNDIAELAGARFVSSIEVDEGKRLAEGLIKLITGGDTVRARFLYQESFEFMPQFKLWLVANHKPDINPDDTAMWRRILVVPFKHVIPEEKRDPHVKATLKNPAVAGPAILAWAVQGCLRWQEYGLQIPNVVKEETESYKQEMDPVTLFVDECCLKEDGARVACRKLTEEFDLWIEANYSKNEAKNKSKGFAKKLKEMGFEQKPTKVEDKPIRMWHGLGLKSIDED